MSAIYSTKATVVGGRSGTVRTDDGLLDLPLAIPREMGGKGDATNPEKLFAAGYAACFESAVIFHTRTKAEKVRDEDIEVTATVGLAPNGQTDRDHPCGSFCSLPQRSLSMREECPT